MSLDREPGFIYRFRHLRRSASGILVPISDEVVHNLMPYEGLNHMLATEFGGGPQLGNWFIALFAGDYTPARALTADTFAGTATEFTAYSSAGRPAWTPGAPIYGQMDNSAAMAQFTFTGAGTIHGAAILSSNVKGGTSGVLASIVRAGTPKTVAATDVLQVTIQQGFITTD